MTLSHRQNGFSLVEALVAMLILAVAAAGLIRATEAHVDSVRAMERRTAAALVAQNRLAELRMAAPGGTGRAGATELLGETWLVSERRKATADPDLIAVTISVRARDEREPLATLDGFIERSPSA